MLFVVLLAVFDCICGRRRGFITTVSQRQCHDGDFFTIVSSVNIISTTATTGSLFFCYIFPFSASNKLIQAAISITYHVDRTTIMTALLARQ